MPDDDDSTDSDTNTRNPGISPNAQAAFLAQCTPALMAEVRRFARKRAHLLRRAGRRVDADYHLELVQDALGDTWQGVFKWIPEERTLLTHVRDVIRQRACNEVVHCRRFPHLSLQVVTGQQRHRIESEISGQSGEGIDRVLLDSLAVQVMSALRRLATGDAEALAVLACWESGVIERTQAMVQTGLSLARYRATRMRISYLAKGLPSQLRQAVQDLFRRAS